VGDGTAEVEVASRFGRLTLPRQVLVERASGTHVMPGNAVLPPHGGIVITRGLQEMACLLADTLPFETAARLLGWQTQAERAAVLCASTLRTLVREHGAALAQAEAGEVAWLTALVADGADLRPHLVPAAAPRRRAGWPAALCAAVDQALAAEAPAPPQGVRVADWERVLSVRRDEQTATDLRRLGPGVGPDEVVASADEVLTRRVQRRQFWELRTARVATTAGYRYVSGTGAAFLATLGLLCSLCRTGGTACPRQVVLLADGACWLRDFFQDVLAPHGALLLLDWYHLAHRCRQISTQVCRDKPTRLRFVRATTARLWRGDVDGALAIAQEHRALAKHVGPLDQWIHYLDTRRPIIPCYRERHQQRQYIGSGHAEKANDLLVARRQKHQGMHWSEETSVALMRLRTLRLNEEWDRYWQQRQTPSLLVA
jgi:Uncharacterised protein family (UPF0236)